MKVEMDTSTPVRSDFSATCVNDKPSIKEDSIVDELSRDSSECSGSVADISFSQNDGDESLCLTLNKSTELFPCSPIQSKNIPQALLPLLDPPNHQWSDSILTPYKFDGENEDSPTILTQILPNNENSHNKSSDFTSTSFQKSYAVEAGGETTLKQSSNSFKDSQNDPGLCSPIIRANQNSKRCIKKLFHAGEENSEVAVNDEISYQSISDMTLCAMEHVCQTSENLYSSNSSGAKLFADTTAHGSNDCDKNTSENSSDEFDAYLTQFFDGNVRYRRRFVYPYDEIKRPVSPIPIDRIIESVLPLEKYEHVRMRKSQIVPRSMVSFNELKNDGGEVELSDDLHMWVTVPVEIDFRFLVTLIYRYRNVYRGLKSFFSIFRVNFVRTKDDIDTYLPISSQLTLFCENQEMITRLHGELRVLKTRIRTRLLEQFVNLFRCHIHLAYNEFGPKKNTISVCVPSFHERKRSSRIIRSKKNAVSVKGTEQRKIKVTTLLPESIAAVQALLADIQDSDFEVSQKIPNEISEHATNGERIISSDRCSVNSMWSSNDNQELELPSFDDIPEVDGKDEIEYPPKIDLLSYECVVDNETRLSKDVGSMLTGFSTARGKRINVRSDQIARGQEMLESVSKTLAQEIQMSEPPSRPVAVDSRLEESHACKRALQITSPLRKLSAFKRMKFESRELNDEEEHSNTITAPTELNTRSDVSVPKDGDLKYGFIAREELADIPQSIIAPRKFSNSMSMKYPKERSTSTSPEICSFIGRLKPSKPPLMNDEIFFRDIELESSLDDSLWMAIENSSLLEKNLSLSTALDSEKKHDMESKTTSSLNSAAHKESEMQRSVSEIDKNFYHGTDDELFSEVSDSIFLSEAGPSTHYSMNNDLRNIDISSITVGFSTAAGAKVDVSRTNLKKAQKIFEDLDQDSMTEEFQFPTSPEIVTKSKISSNTKRKVPQFSLEESKAEVEGIPRTSVSSTSVTGSRGNVSSTALQEDQKSLENIHRRSISPEIGFKTSNRPKIPELAAPWITSAEMTSKMSVSFRTAAGHTLSVQNLGRAQKFMKDVEADLMKETLKRSRSPEIGSYPRRLSERPKPTLKSGSGRKVGCVPPNKSVSFNPTSVSRAASEKGENFLDHLQTNKNLAEEDFKHPISPEIVAKSKSKSKPKVMLKSDEKQSAPLSNRVSGSELCSSQIVSHEVELFANRSDLTTGTPCDTSPEIGRKQKMLSTRLKFRQLTFVDDEEKVKTEASFCRASEDVSSVPLTVPKRPRECSEMVDETSVAETSSKTPEFALERQGEGVGMPSKISISFSTAAGSKLNAPKAFLKKAQKIFKDVDEDLVEEAFFRPISPEVGLDASARSSTSNENSHPMKISSSRDSGFGNNITSKKTDEDSVPKFDLRSLSPEIGLTSKSLSSARSRLPKITFQSDDEGSLWEASKMPVSFATAAGNKVTVSKTVLKKVEKLFQDVDRESGDELSKFSSGFSQVSNAPSAEFNETKQHPVIDGVPFSTRDELLQDRSECPAFSHRIEKERECLNLSLGQPAKNASNVPVHFSLQSDDLESVCTAKDEPSATIRPRLNSSVDVPRPVSPVVETRRSYPLKRRQKRRSQLFNTTLSSAPLSVIYNGKENENVLNSSKTSPEDLLRKIKDTFSQRSNKRKEPVSGSVGPVSKRSKESETVVDTANVDGGPRCGSYLWHQKNTKRMTLREAVNGVRPGRYTAQELVECGLKLAVISVDAQNASQFVFSSPFLGGENSNNVYGDRCTILPNENNEIRFENLVRGFLASPGVDPGLISEEWIRNHYRWIVWKLAAFEKSYPHLFGNNYLTLNNVLYQLKYRYDREIDHCERSALKRVIECDDSPSKPMILCVASVKSMSGTLNEFELELTDGWYSIWSQLDLEMYKLIMKKKVVIGTKLFIMNAELVGLTEGRDPLEIDSTVRFKIATNSTRLARWDARLGFYTSSSLPVIRDLKTILPNGGITYPLVSVVTRVYPMLYLEKKCEGYSELYNEKMEFKKATKFQKERQDCWEQLASVITREVERESDIGDSDDYVKTGTTLDEIALQVRATALKVATQLIFEVSAVLKQFQNQRIANQEKLNSAIKERIESRLPDRFRQPRIVLRLLKIRIVDDCNDGDQSASMSAIVTIWNPSEDVVSLLKEGKLYLLRNLSASDIRNRELKLTSNRMTRYELQSTLPRSTCHQRRYTMIGELKRDYISLFNEIDIVGVVVGSEVSDSNQHIIYLADLRQNILATKFRFNLKDYGFEEVLKKKSIVAAVNLQWRSETIPSSNIPCTCVSEYTTFTQKSRLQHLQSHLTEFESHFKFKCLDMFVEECEKKLKYPAQSYFPTATSTPVRYISVKDADVQGSKVSDVSGPSINTSSNFDLSLRSKDTQSRIDRLRQYGEPPPLSPITMSSVSNVRRRAARLSIQTSSFRSNNCGSRRSM